MAESISGKVSWFGGPNDAETGTKLTASGAPTSTPGIAVYNRSTLGGFWRVTDPKTGKTAVLKQTDLGPSPSTGRKIDVTYSALNKFGYGEHNFPTDSTFNATYLGKTPGAAASALSAPVSAPVTSPSLPRPSASPAASPGPNKMAILAKLFQANKEGGASNPLFASGVLSNQAGAISTAPALKPPSASAPANVSADVSPGALSTAPAKPNATGVTSGPTAPTESAATGPVAPSPFAVGAAVQPVHPHVQLQKLAGEIMQWNHEPGHLGIDAKTAREIFQGLVPIEHVKQRLTPPPAAPFQR